MFDRLSSLPADPILGLSAAFQKDNNPAKVDLGVGVYKNESGQTPVLESVKLAQQKHIAEETTKAYLGPMGLPAYTLALQQLILGQSSSPIRDQRVSAIQTPGGCGALSVGARLIKRAGLAAGRDATLWVTDPTWANHLPLFGEAGIEIKTFPFYDAENKGLKREEMFAALTNVPRGDLVLLHGCCHNPSGVDLTTDDWVRVAELAEKNGFIPFVDMAYQGFGTGLDDDAQGVRLLTERLPEVVVAYSCSKNFGLYRERTGLLMVVSESSAVARACNTQLASITRAMYSMPPAHGAALVALILGDDQLRALWVSELQGMCERINSLRSVFASKLQAACGGRDFSFIERQRGMFSFLGLTVEQVEALRHQHSVYMVGSSRVSISGLNQCNLDYVANAVGAVL